jgi:adenylate kinase
LSSGLDPERQALIADEELLSKHVKEIIKKTDGCIVVDGHLATSVLGAKDIAFAFVLRRDPDDLLNVLVGRGFAERKARENVAAEILDVCLFDAVETYGEGKVCEVDVSDKSLQDVANEIISVVSGQSRCRTGIVDWLTRLESQGRLDDFLASL